MAFGTTLDEMEALIGHDGGEIIYPGEKEPECRRGVTMHEITDVGLQLGFGLVRMDMNPMVNHGHIKEPRNVYLDQDERIKWVHDLLVPTIWLGPRNSLSHGWHHLVWDPKTTDYFDPRGFRIRKPNIEFVIAWLVFSVGDLPRTSVGAIQRTEEGKYRRPRGSSKDPAPRV
jgi:hypothetical protein